MAVRQKWNSEVDEEESWPKTEYISMIAAFLAFFLNVEAVNSSPCCHLSPFIYLMINAGGWKWNVRHFSSNVLYRKTLFSLYFLSICFQISLRLYRKDFHFIPRSWFFSYQFALLLLAMSGFSFLELNSTFREKVINKVDDSPFLNKKIFSVSQRVIFTCNKLAEMSWSSYGIVHIFLFH